jgi:hypothetical protein
MRYFLSAGHTWTGDTARTRYEDVDSLSLGAEAALGTLFSLGASAGYASALLKGYDPLITAAFSAGYSFAPGWQTNLSYARGLSETAAEEALNLMVLTRF